MSKHSSWRNHAEALGFRVLLATMQYPPRSAAEHLGRFYAGTLDRLVPRLRRYAYVNLQFAYPDRDDAWRRKTVDGVFASIGRILVALSRFPTINRNQVPHWIQYEGFEHYQAAKERGCGVLFATAHLGNWELSAFSHALLTEPMNVVVRPLDNPVLDGIVENRRSLSGNRLLSKRDFARTILQALRSNEPVGILMDQNTAPENGVFVPFFGKLACANVTFAKIAARTGAAVIPGFAFWSEVRQRYILKFYPAVTMTSDPMIDTARIQAAIEAAIRESPDQWLWIHRRWKTRPSGELPLY